MLNCPFAKILINFKNLTYYFPWQVNVSMLVRYTLQMIGSLAFMFYLNAALTGVLLAVVPIVSIVAVQYGESDINTEREWWGGVLVGRCDWKAIQYMYV